MRAFFFSALLFLSAIAFAQSDAPRGSTPPGVSQDGARPAEGAIQGGSIAPGETGGMPRKAPGASSPAAAGASRLQRCYQLEGTLREQCLADEAIGKEGSAPRAPGSAPGRDRPISPEHPG